MSTLLCRSGAFPALGPCGWPDTLVWHCVHHASFFLNSSKVIRSTLLTSVKCIAPKTLNLWQLQPNLLFGTCILGVIWKFKSQRNSEKWLTGIPINLLKQILDASLSQYSKYLLQSPGISQHFSSLFTSVLVRVLLLWTGYQDHGKSYQGQHLIRAGLQI